MDDWLTELRESKQHAITQAQREMVRNPLPREATADQLQSGQAHLAALIKTVQVEPLLREFTEEILQGHPFFSETSLTRALRSRAIGSPIELTEPAPWSAPVAGNPLPDALELGNAHYVTAITWKLQANYRNQHQHEIQVYRLRVSVSAGQVLIDGQPVLPQTSDAFKIRLATTFKHSLEYLNRHRVRHHHRPWYRRLWRTFFPRANLAVTFLMVAIIVLALAILLAVFAGQIIPGVPWGVRPGR